MHAHLQTTDQKPETTPRDIRHFLFLCFFFLYLINFLLNARWCVNLMHFHTLHYAPNLSGSSDHLFDTDVCTVDIEQPSPNTLECPALLLSAQLCPALPRSAPLCPALCTQCSVRAGATLVPLEFTDRCEMCNNYTDTAVLQSCLFLDELRAYLLKASVQVTLVKYGRIIEYNASF